MSTVDFDDIMIEVDDDLMGEPVGLPLSRIPSEPSVTFPTEPYDSKRALKLVDEPEKLFDFKESKLTPVQQLYIVSYATKGTKMGACKLAGISYNVVEKWMRDDTFVSALQNATNIVQDTLEEELYRRAMNGSDKLLLEALKANRPDKYAVKSSSDINVHGEIVHTWADLAKAAAGDDDTAMIETDYEEVE